MTVLFVGQPAGAAIGNGLLWVCPVEHPPMTAGDPNAVLPSHYLDAGLIEVNPNLRVRPIPVLALETNSVILDLMVNPGVRHLVLDRIDGNQCIRAWLSYATVEPAVWPYRRELLDGCRAYPLAVTVAVRHVVVADTPVEQTFT